MRLLILFMTLACFPIIAWSESLEDLLVAKGLISRSEASETIDRSEVAKIYWKGGTVVEFPENAFSTKIKTIIQSRYTFTDEDDSSSNQNTSSFRMRRVRLNISGNALREEFDYYVQVDFVGGKDASGARVPALLDAFLTWHVSDVVALRTGQFKTGISRQNVNSSTQLQFPDRSIASEFFNLDRQIGAAVLGDWNSGNLQASAAIFNGESSGEGINRPGLDTKHTGVVNIRANLIGKMDAFTEGDIETTSGMAINSGLAAAFSQAAESGMDRDLQTINADLNIKSEGASLHTEFYWQKYDPDSGMESEPIGFYIQGGYFLEPQVLEIAARYAAIDCDNGLAGDDCSGVDDRQESSVSLNHFWWKHYLKAQLAYVFEQVDLVDRPGSEIKTNKWMMQVSTNF
ncbi:MAG: hypothetical protein KDD42_00245 [Bdellovibrionales bacterium]|nr:hypothetical protein [Bdellovibrionales bacterium]